MTRWESRKARWDRASARIAGSEKCRVEPLIGEMEHLSMERQLIPIIRDADNSSVLLRLPDTGGRSLWSVEVLHLLSHPAILERCLPALLLQVAGQVLTRDFMDQSIEAPLKKLLDDRWSRAPYWVRHVCRPKFQ